MGDTSAAAVKALRERTGAGMMDCKKALLECDGDMDKAIDFLREKGLAAAAKKEGRIAAEGVVESYIHGNGRIGVLIEVNCETDFVARSDSYRQLVKDIAMQIAAAKPEYLAISDVPEDVIEHEKEIYRQQALNEGKPESLLDKLVLGRLDKFYQEVCLLEQTYIKDEKHKLKIKDLLLDQVSKIGEKISVRRFARFELGEGLEKRQDNFVDEVMKEMQR
jgi:elongation factor Ts